MKFLNEAIAKFQSLADSIKSNAVFKEGSIQEIEVGKAYNDNLPDGHTPDSVKSLSKYNSEFVTASHIAVADIASDLFMNDKSLKVLEAEIGFGAPRDTISINIERSHTYQNHLAKNDSDKEVVKHLSMTTSVDVKGARGTSLKRIKDIMGEEFAGTFKK